MGSTVVNESQLETAWTKAYVRDVPKGNGWSTSYYKVPAFATELGHLIEHKNMNFNVGNIFKACYRLGEKTGTSALYDINKIIWFAQMEKQRIERISNGV